MAAVLEPAAVSETPALPPVADMSAVEAGAWSDESSIYEDAEDADEEEEKCDTCDTFERTARRVETKLAEAEAAAAGEAEAPAQQASLRGSRSPAAEPTLLQTAGIGAGALQHHAAAPSSRGDCIRSASRQGVGRVDDLECSPTAHTACEAL